MLALTLPRDIDERLEALATRTGRSKSEHAIDAILEHLSDLEDAAVAEQRWSDLQEGRSTARPLAEVVKSYGLDD